jgi:hypothetical protein
LIMYVASLIERLRSNFRQLAAIPSARSPHLPAGLDDEQL